MCDILSLKICYITLGHTRLWDHHAERDVSANTYLIIKGNTKLTITCAINMTTLKLTSNF